MILSLFRKDPAKDAARALYAAAAEQARTPFLYTALATPDTVEGRFEQVALHVFLILRRLKSEGDAARRMAQLLFDAMFADLDSSLRELGVGDLSVGRKIRKLAEDFYGRAGAYEVAMKPDAASGALDETLFRNVYAGAQGAPAAALAAYVRAAAARLAESPLGRILAGVVEFPDPAGIFEGPGEARR
ncbi:MAG: ubiquinol-cytochrome C chaperone family protein [Parvularculaceae bacterium]